MFKSIKLKLVIWFLVVFSVVFAGIEVYLYYKLEDVVLRLVDDHLESSMQSLSNLIALEESHGTIERELQELSTTATGPYIEKLSGHYYQVANTEGEVIVTSPSLGLADAFLPARKGVFLEPKFETLTGPNGESLRMISKSVKFDIGYLTVQGADNLATTYKLVVSFRSIILFIFPAVFILCGVGVFIMTGVALKSLKVFSDKVGEITAESLGERIEDEQIPLELKPLASNFNTMLERLEQSFGRQKQFLSDASHELRTPTSIIKSFCDVTLNKQRSAAEYAETLTKVRDTVNRMCDIINRILVISRLDTKTIHFQPEKMDVLDVMKDVLRLIEPAAIRKSIKISLGGPNVQIKGDREGITEVFTNIVENAIKYNKENGSVEIQISDDADKCVVRVSDTGIGIPETDKEKIFDRFFRVDASRSVTVGSGLGLSIVKTIIEAHSGTIDVSSELGKGTAFTVVLPKIAELKP